MLAALAREPDPHTTVSNPDEAVDIHVADSLSGLEIEEVRSAGWIADVGAGAGFPGLALAVALPRARVDMIESASRKCAVIDRLTHAAGLDNEIVRAMPMRSEERAAWGGREAYDVVTARALGSAARARGVRLPTAGGRRRVRGVEGQHRSGRARARIAGRGEVGLELERVVEVQPWPEARDRRLVVYRKLSPAPERFPRRAGMATKRPLS